MGQRLWGYFLGMHLPTILTNCQIPVTLNNGPTCFTILPLKILNLDINENHCNFTLVHDCLEVKNRIEQFSVGKIVDLQIRCIKEYGVIGNIVNNNNFKLTGFIRIDNVSESPPDNLNSIFTIGQIVKAVIIDVAASIRHFSLSTKLLES